MPKIILENSECSEAVPLGLTLLRRQKASMNMLRLPAMQREYTQSDFSMSISTSKVGEDLLRITGGAFTPDVMFIERLGAKRFSVYGYDLKTLRIYLLASFESQNLTDVDITPLADSDITVGVRAAVDKTVDVFVSDNRHESLPYIEDGYYKGIIGEGRQKGRASTSKTWLWNAIPEGTYTSPDAADLWESLFPPQVSSNKHITKSGFEMCYASEVVPTGSVRSRWFIRDRNEEAPAWSLLFDLSTEPVNYYQEIDTVELDFMPALFDDNRFALVTDNSVYMRVLVGDYSDPTEHEWWTLWRDNIGGEWQPWQLYFDGSWSRFREDASEWVFQQTIFDPTETFTGYNEMRTDGLCRFWLVTSGNPMTSPIGYFDYDLSTLGVTVAPGTVNNQKCWILEGTETYGFLFTNKLAGTGPVQDALVKRVSGVFENVYLPDPTRTLRFLPHRISRNGRYYMGIEQDRVAPSGATTDIILIDMLTGAKKVLNRTPAYTQFFGRNIVWPFTFVEPMRTL